ncbi:TPR repeat family protein [Mycobacterium kansasii 824]|nr:TPR repeat family protein [Mycobacterium kansasii 824]
MTAEYFDLGSYHRPIETSSAEAQLWFDRGLVWAYAFNHEEAIRCFERALALDPELAIARWGIAYAVGPNYNKAWEAFDPFDLSGSLARARMELQLAERGRASPVEQGLIAALRTRFPTGDLHAGVIAYADAMTSLAAAYPDDVDVQALAADALVNVSAWALWDTATGEPAAGSRVVEAKRILDAALATPAGREHPGSCICTCTPWRCRRLRRMPYRRRTCCAAWCLTPGICSTCPATSTCCAATIAAR